MAGGQGRKVFEYGFRAETGIIAQHGAQAHVGISTHFDRAKYQPAGLDAVAQQAGLGGNAGPGADGNQVEGQQTIGVEVDVGADFSAQQAVERAEVGRAGEQVGGHRFDGLFHHPEAQVVEPPQRIVTGPKPTNNRPFNRHHQQAVQRQVSQQGG